ncbi:hypothetical protein D3C79_1004700 [compost metagenome]
MEKQEHLQPGDPIPGLCRVHHRGDSQRLRLLAEQRIVRLAIRVRHAQLGAAVIGSGAGNRPGRRAARRGIAADV